AGAGAVGEHPVAAEARVDHAEVGRLRVVGKAAGEVVGPAGVAAGERPVTVGDGVAEGDDGAARALHVEPVDDVPGAGAGAEGAAAQVPRVVAAGEVGGVLGVRVHIDRTGGARQEDADQQLFARADGQRDGVGDDLLAPAEGGAPTAPEGDGVPGTDGGGGAAGAPGDLHG